MTDFLVRRFVKNYEHVQWTEVRTSYGMLSSSVGIFCNILLFLVKLLVGILMHSIAVTADAFNNLSDAASSVISFVGVRMAGKPADKEHPFGHGRVEYIAAFIVSFFVIQVGFTFFKSSAGKILEPEEISFELVPFLILALSVLVKVWMGAFNRKLGKRIDSKVMLAVAADSMGDVATTSVTIASILVYRILGWNIDAYAGIIVSLLVVWAGIGIARETLKPLIGEPIDPQLYQDITEMVESFEGIVGTHDLIVHNYGPNLSMASIHAEVPREADIEKSHEVIDQAERKVLRKLGVYLVIHTDPVEVQDQWVLGVKKQLQCVIGEIDAELDFHDFHLVQEDGQVHLVFDLVTPYDYGEQRQDQLRLQVMEAMQNKDSRYQCVITMDKSFVGESS